MEQNKINKTLLLVTSPLFYIIDRFLLSLNLKMSNKVKLAILIIFSLSVFIYALSKIIT